VISFGTAGDQYRFKTTYQFFQTEVLTDALPILIFSGNIQFSYGCYVRIPTTSDAELRSIQFLGEIPEQALVQITEIKSDEW
ncbi:MAG: hypothetical protein LH679_24940, partial [Cyanobacteria bacterium CAN_BIN43]|nr:hypothetical protein [Cyanobacteria bacterium CAN_BIN43]